MEFLSVKQLVDHWVQIWELSSFRCWEPSSLMVLLVELWSPGRPCILIDPGYKDRVVLLAVLATPAGTRLLITDWPLFRAEDSKANKDNNVPYAVMMR